MILRLRFEQISRLRFFRSCHCIQPVSSPAPVCVRCRETAYVPQWYAWATALLRHLPSWANEMIMNNAYLLNSAEYVRRIADVAKSAGKPV